ncbi:MAG: Rieske (2Fe-2S) protein, partial [Actinoplanes sp.]
VVVTACSSSSESSGGAPTADAPTANAPGGGTQAGGAPSSTAGTLGSTGEIPVGGGKIFGDQGVVVTQPKPGEFKGFSNICTHQRCPVASVKDGTINCNCHGSKFSIEDGSVKHPPATRPLPAKEIKVDGGMVSLA